MDDDQAAKISVGLYMYGQDLDPVDATKVMGCQPTRSRRAGDEKTSSSGRRVVFKDGLWARVLHAESAAEIGELLQDISFNAANHSSVPHAEQPGFDLYVGRAADADGNARVRFDIPAETLRALADAGLPLKVTFTSSPP